MEPTTERSASEIIEIFNELLDSADFEGAEEHLTRALVEVPRLEPFLQFQFGKLYSRWNKLTSAVNHLALAAELARKRGDELFEIQVVEELKSVRHRQLGQKP